MTFTALNHESLFIDKYCFMSLAHPSPGLSESLAASQIVSEKHLVNCFTGSSCWGSFVIRFSFLRSSS